MRETTFSPQINKESYILNRSYDDMLVWQEKSRIKTEMRREFKNIADYDERDFKPSIKSGSKTQPRYMQPKVQSEIPVGFFENREIFDKIDPDLSRAYEKEIRKEFTPKINSKSRSIVAQKKTRRCKKKKKSKIYNDDSLFENFREKIENTTKDTKRSNDYNYLNLKELGASGTYDPNEISTFRQGDQASSKLDFTTSREQAMMNNQIYTSRENETVKSPIYLTEEKVNIDMINEELSANNIKSSSKKEKLSTENLEYSNYDLVTEDKNGNSMEANSKINNKQRELQFTIDKTAFRENGEIIFQSPVKKFNKGVKKVAKNSKSKKNSAKSKKNTEKKPKNHMKDLIDNTTFSPAYYIENMKQIYTVQNSPIRSLISPLNTSVSPNIRKKKNRTHDINPDFNFVRASNAEKLQDKQYDGSFMKCHGKLAIDLHRNYKDNDSKRNQENKTPKVDYLSKKTDGI